MNHGRRIKSLVALARETPLDAYYKWAQIFALVSTPFLVAMVGAVATWSTKEAEVAVNTFSWPVIS